MSLNSGTFCPLILEGPKETLIRSHRSAKGDEDERQKRERKRKNKKVKAEEDEDDANGGNTLRGGGKKGPDSQTCPHSQIGDCFFIIIKDGWLCIAI